MQTLTAATAKQPSHSPEQNSTTNPYKMDEHIRTVATCPVAQLESSLSNAGVDCEGVRADPHGIKWTAMLGQLKLEHGEAKRCASYTDEGFAKSSVQYGLLMELLKQRLYYQKGESSGSVQSPATC